MWPRRGEQDGNAANHSIPESFSAFCNIVSFTAAKTSRIFDVSVACVRLDGVRTYKSNLKEGGSY